ncbi:MAG: TIGR02679 family protein [Euzebya sp.]
MGADPRLADLLDGPDLAWLRDRVRRRLQRGRAVSGVITLSNPTEAQIAAASRLLGRPFRRVVGLRVDLDQVSTVLARAGVARDLATGLEALEGPVDDVAQEERRLAKGWSGVVAALASGLATAGADGLVREDRVSAGWAEGWIQELQSTGLLKRLAGGDPVVGARLVEQLLSVVNALPAGQVFRSRFAAEVLGSAKALDRGPLATLTRSALRAWFGRPVLPGAEGRVELWAAAGILVGDLTSTVLVAGFGGDPSVWTLREVAGGRVDVSVVRGRTVWVVENPTVVAEAVRILGTACPPMICTHGRPTVAVLTLLRMTSPLAGKVAYHGDFDWDGVDMCNRLIQRIGVTPWRMATADYLAAVGSGTAGVALREGREVEASWDPELAPALRRVGVAVEEEAVMPSLLADLGLRDPGDCGARPDRLGW